MEDPTRIPDIVDRLRTAWEGQPDLTLAQLWGVLESRGVGWGSSDDEVRSVLGSLIDAYPSRLTLEFLKGHCAIVDTVSPARRISLDGSRAELRVTVRDMTGRMRPATWTGGALKKIATMAPAIITDAEGIDHRLGVVERIRVVDSPELIDLAGRTRQRMFDEVYGVTLVEDKTDGFVIIGHRVDVYRIARREILTEQVPFAQIVSCRAGLRLVIDPGSGRAPVDLGEVADVFLLEA